MTDQHPEQPTPEPTGSPETPNQGVNPSGAADSTAGQWDQTLRSLSSSASTRDDGSLDVLATIGGWRGLIESVLPSAVFLVMFTLTGELWGAGIGAVAVAAVFSVLRLIQRQSPVQALAGLAAVALCVVVALNTGEARDFYVWGFITNAVYIVVLSISVLVGWPLLGVVFGLIRGEGLEWRASAARRRRYGLATWFVVTALALRLIVQVPLYLSENLVALGTTRLAMGLPLYGLALWMAWLVSAPAGQSPADQDRLDHPERGDS